MTATFFFLTRFMLVKGAPINTTPPPINNVFYQPQILRNASEIAPAWLPNPRQRGTLDIIWSCLFTLSLCVYTAIHLNVPPPNEGKFGFLGRKTKWVFIGILAPELVVYAAWKQLRQASNVARRLSELREQNKKDGISYDLSYGFYVAMGGFVADVSELHSSYERVTITATGIIELARLGQFMDIDARSIADKSKADIFAKGMVMAQLVWLIVNCIGRKVARYPLTLLEIHTCVHVLCALIIYCIWLKKPVDIREPTMIDFRDHSAHQALLLMASPSAFPWKKPRMNYLAEVDILHYNNLSQTAGGFRHPPPSEIDENGWKWTIEDQTFEIDLPVVYDLRNSSGSEGYLQSGKFYKKIGPGFMYYTADDLPENGQWAITKDERMLKANYQARVRMRLEMNNILTKRWETILPLLDDAKRVYTSQTRLRERLNISEDTGDLITTRAKNLDLSSSTTISGAFRNFTATLQGRHGDMSSGLLLFLLPALYGGIHISAWTFEFPTSVEQMLWKIACLDLVVSLPVFLIGSLARELGTNGKQFTLGDMALLSWLGILFLIVNIPATVVARAYLVVESFASLRRVPVGVYATVPWSDWLPHI